MATRTAYQQQADGRIKRAIKLRAQADAKIRKYAVALTTALAAAENAREVMNHVNTVYNRDISTETLLAHSLRDAGTKTALTAFLAESTPGEEVQIFSAQAPGASGDALPSEAVFGEPVLAPVVLSQTSEK